MRRLAKAALKTGSGSAVSLFLAAAAMKILALLLGPTGVGLFSLLRQSQQTASLIGTFGGQNALVQGLSSKRGAARDEYLVTAFWIFVLGALLTAVVTIIFAPELATWIFDQRTSDGMSMVRWLSVPIAVSVIQVFFGAVLNAGGAIGSLAWAQVIAALLVAVAAYPLAGIAHQERPQALVWLLSGGIAGSAIFCIIVAYRKGLLAALRRLDLFHPSSFRHFTKIGGTTLVTSLAAAGTVLITRAAIVHSAGLGGAGIFDVAWTLSMMYVMVILNSFSTYYLPTLSGFTTNPERLDLIVKMIRFSTALAVPLVVAVIVFKPLVVGLLYSSQFTGALTIMRWMLLADFLKITSWVLAMPMVAMADMRSFLISELVANAAFLLLALLGMRFSGDAQFIGIAFFITYVGYLIYTYFYVRSRLQFVLGKALLFPWLAGIALIATASFFSWNSHVVNWITVPAWAIFAGTISWWSLTIANPELRQTLIRLLFGRRLKKGGQFD